MTVVLTFWIILTCLVPSHAQEIINPSNAITQAKNYYDNGDYQSALDIQLKLSKLMPHSAATHYNTGNAAFKLENYGLALLHFLKAEKGNPLDKDIKHNTALTLELVRQQNSFAIPTLQFLSVRSIPFYTHPEFILVLGLLFLTLFQLCFFVKKRVALAKLGTGFLAILFISTALFIYLENRLKLDVVVSDKSTVRSGPGNTFPEITTVSNGSLLRVERESNGWHKVSFYLYSSSNSEIVGWINNEQTLAL